MFIDGTTLTARRSTRTASTSSEMFHPPRQTPSSPRNDRQFQSQSVRYGPTELQRVEIRKRGLQIIDRKSSIDVSFFSPMTFRVH